MPQLTGDHLYKPLNADAVLWETSEMCHVDINVQGSCNKLPTWVYKQQQTVVCMLWHVSKYFMGVPPSSSIDVLSLVYVDSVF